VIDADAIVPREVRERYANLPDHVMIRDREIEIHYEVESTPEGTTGVARLRLPEKLARTLVEEELPTLDRPLRFIVTRGARGAARGDTLDALQEELERPFTPAEIEDLERAHEQRRNERRDRKRHRAGRHAARQFRERSGRGKRRRR
jgi:hypothetical protein